MNKDEFRMKQQGSTGKQEKLRESRRRRSASDRRRSEKARLEDCRSAPQAVPQQNKMKNNEHRKITARNEG